MMELDALRILESGPVQAEVVPPGSKSITNRALLISALAVGKSTLTGALDSEDTQIMFDVLRKLGLCISQNKESHLMFIDGQGGIFPVKTAELYVGNSGTSARFLTAALCFSDGIYRIFGKERMHSRPIGDLIDALRNLGADVISEFSNGCPPIILRGRKIGCACSVTVAGNISSQYLSALLMSVPLCSSVTTSVQTSSAQTTSAQTNSAQTSSVQTSSAQTNSAQTNSAQTSSVQTSSVQTNPTPTEPLSKELVQVDLTPLFLDSDGETSVENTSEIKDSNSSQKMSIFSSEMFLTSAPSPQTFFSDIFLPENDLSKMVSPEETFQAENDQNRNCPQDNLLKTPVDSGSFLQINVSGELVSRPYIEMTLKVMRSFGINVRHNEQMSCFEVPIGVSYQPQEYRIEPDASAASYFFAVPMIVGGRLTVLGLSKDSLQGDIAFVDALAKMGANVHYESDRITVERKKDADGNFLPIHGIDIDMNAFSDTVQTLSIVALFADSPTRIRNVKHIRYKETDRIAAVVKELRKLGAVVEEFEDGLLITPSLYLHGAVIETYDDHRMAMSFALVGLKIRDVIILNPKCCAKTYPNFFDDLAAVRTPVLIPDDDMHA